MNPPLLRQVTIDDGRTAQSVLNPESAVSYADINRVLRDSYNFDSNHDSTALDIMALYLKGQKIIYTESKTLCEKRLNTLMLPAIFIAAVCSILNFILKDYSYGTVIISSLNAFNSFILALISYLKLDGKAEAHKTSAYKYQKLEAMVEFQSGKSLFFRNSVDVHAFVGEIEKQVMDIRESNQFLPPEQIRVMYPTICETNVFSLVKEIQNKEIIVINRLKTVVQQLHAASTRSKAIETEIGIVRQSIEAIELEMLEEERREEREEREEEKMKSDKKDDESEKSKESKEYLCVRRLNELRQRMAQLSESLKTTRQEFDECEQQKNDAFDAAVTHRERYLKLSETFKEEIAFHNNRRRDRVCINFFNLCDWCKT